MSIASDNMEDYLLSECDKLIVNLFDELKGDNDEPEVHEVIPLLLFQSMVDKLYALKVLRDDGRGRIGNSGYGIVRTMFECQWHLLFMIKDDSIFRAMSYHYFSRLEEAKSNLKDIEYKLSLNRENHKKREENIKGLNELIEQCRKGMNDQEIDVVGPFFLRAERLGYTKHPLLSLMHELELYTNLRNGLVETKKELEIEKQQYKDRIELLSQDDRYKEIRNRIDSSTLDYPNWYNLKDDRIKSLRQLAKRLGLLKQYDGAYSLFSLEIHGINATTKVVLKEGKAVLKGMNPDVLNSEAQDAFNAGFYTLSQTVEKLMKFYKKDEEWKTLFDNMYKLNRQQLKH